MRIKGIYNYIIHILAGFLLFNLIWYILAFALHLKVLPYPLEVYAGYSNAIDNGIGEHLLASLWRTVFGMIIASVIALLFGLSMGYNRTIDKIFGPLLYFSYPIPKLALLPIVMIIFGIGEISKIIFFELIIVFQLILTIRDSVKAIPKDDYGVLISLRANNINKLRHITLPAILPFFLSSLRVSLGIAMSALFFTETFGTDKGLGFYITDSWMRIDYIQMYFGIFVLSLSGFILFLFLDLLEKYFCKWKNL